MSLLKNIRFWVLVFSALLSVYYLFNIKPTLLLTRTLALTAIAYLYLTLLAGPFVYTFKQFPFRVQYIKARRALGVSVFYFGFLHAYFAFNGVLGVRQLADLPSLPLKYLIAITLSLTSLFILALMTATANDFMIEKLGFPKWKFLHRFIYLVGLFTLIHALLIGTDFKSWNLVSEISLPLILFLLALEVPRIIKFFQRWK